MKTSHSLLDNTVGLVARAHTEGGTGSYSTIKREVYPNIRGHISTYLFAECMDNLSNWPREREFVRLLTRSLIATVVENSK